MHRKLVFAEIDGFSVKINSIKPGETITIILGEIEF